MQANGSLTETQLRTLLEEAQSERATGTLTVRNGGRACSLYFLFGHLFHALGEGVTGDDAVIDALHWHSGDFNFDARAKLPADETVKLAIPDLINNADSSSQNGNPGQPELQQQAMPAAEEDTQPTPVVEPVGWHAVTPESGAEPAADTQEAAPAPEPEAMAPAEKPEPEPQQQPQEEPHVEAPQPRRGVKHRPQPKHGREPIPVPAGHVVYDSLKTSFVDFPRLITTLERESYTGYVRLLTDDASGLIFFRDGRVLECVYDASGLQRGADALRSFNEVVTHGQGVLDVVGLSPELIDGLYDLTVARPIYTELYASWVDMHALLKHLKERHLTGSVMVRGGTGTGVIILTEGKVTGAYTSESRDIAKEVDGVLELCQDPNAMIEVKAAEDGKEPNLNVDEIVGTRIRGGSGAAAQAAAPPAPAPDPPPAPAEPTPTTSKPVAAEQQKQQAPPPMPTSPPMQAVEPPPVQQSVQPEPVPPAPPDGEAQKWEAAIQDLQGIADNALGNRARKVKDLLAGADRSQRGVEEAINEVPKISLLFVDSSRLESLADEMRTRLQAYQ